MMFQYTYLYKSFQILGISKLIRNIKYNRILV